MYRAQHVRLLAEGIAVLTCCQDGQVPHLLLLQVDHDLGRPQRHLLHEVQVLVPAANMGNTMSSLLGPNEQNRPAALHKWGPDGCEQT